MIRFTCRTCHERLAVPVRYAGRRGKCPACGAVNLVPVVSELPEPAPAPVMVHPGRLGARPSSAGLDLDAPPQATRTASIHSPAQVEPERPRTTALPWSAPAPPPAKSLPEVAPLPDDIPTGEMVLVSAFDDDAGGISTATKVMIAAAVLVGLAGMIWGVSYLLIFVRMKMTR